jgi:hypothetical protein
MPVLIGFILGAVYVAGVWKFLSGFNKTNFTSNKVVLALLWPALVFNANYRRNFTKALKE